MKNQNNLDEYYFKLKLELIVQGIHNYTPEELSRELIRLARTADVDTLMAESELIATQIRGRVVGMFDVVSGKTLNDYVYYETGLSDGGYQLVAVQKVQGTEEGE